MFEDGGGKGRGQGDGVRGRGGENGDEKVEGRREDKDIGEKKVWNLEY